MKSHDTMSNLMLDVNISSVPYQCPQCHQNGTKNDFVTLLALKNHLKSRHSYRFVVPLLTEQVIEAFVGVRTRRERGNWFG